MSRFKTFFVAYLASYALVTGIGVLLQLRPWERDTASWVSQHSQIFIFDFLVFQIPGLAVLPGLLLASPWPELFLLVSSIFLATWTWKDWRLPEKAELLQRLGRYSYFLALLALFFRLIMPILLPQTETTIENPWDIRDPRVTLAWISFQTTLMLTLVIVHLTLRLCSRPKELPAN